MNFKRAVIAGLVILNVSMLNAKEEIIKTTVDTIGCEDKSGLGDATSAFLSGGFSGFLPYVKSHGCLFLRNGSEVTKLKTKMPNVQILYHNPFGKDRTLWVGYDVI